MSDNVDRALTELRDAIDEIRSGEGDREEFVALLHAVERKFEAPDDSEHHDNLVDHLNEAITSFESSHPTLAQILERAANTLSAAGI